jgi:hypothetical protein
MSLAGTVTAVKNIATKLLGPLTELSATNQNFHRDPGEANGEKVDLAQLAASDEDFEAGVVDIVDRARARWIERHGASLIANGAVGGGVHLSFDRLTLTTSPPQLPAELDGPMTFDAQCWFHPTEMRAGLRAAVAAALAVRQQRQGPPIHQRPAMVERLNATIAGIEDAQAALADAAAALTPPIHIPLLEDVASRRRAAAFPRLSTKPDDR